MSNLTLQLDGDALREATVQAMLGVLTPEAKELKPNDMTDDQRECYRLLCDLVRGEHHLIGKVSECGRGIHFGMRCRSMATFDYDDLTRLVVMSHDRMIRVEIVPTGFGTIGIDLHKRHTREGEMHKRHPTMEDAIARVRGVSSNASLSGLPLGKD